MVQVPQSVKTNKEWIYIGWLILFMFTSNDAPQGYTLVWWAIGLAPFVLGILVVGKLAKFEAGIRTIMLASINTLDYEYEEGNNQVQFVLGQGKRVTQIGSNSFHVEHPLEEPYIIHPTDKGKLIYTHPTPIKTLRYYAEFHPNDLFTGQLRQWVKWLDEHVKSDHTDKATLDEISYHVDPDSGEVEPIFRVIEGTESFALRHKRDVRLQQQRAEAMRR
jgi:hypothetical protein